MSRILVHPEGLLRAGNVFGAAAADLLEIQQRLYRATQSLSWDSKQRIGMEREFQEAANRARQLAGRIHELSGSLRRTAEAFQNLDQQSAGQLQGRLAKSRVAVSPYFLAAAGLSALGSLLPKLGADWRQLIDPKKMVGNVATLYEAYQAIDQRMKGFYIEKVSRASGDFYRVHNGQTVGINGRKYAISNQHQTPHVAKYLDPKVAAAEAVKWKSLKSLGGLGIAVEAAFGVKENIDANAGGSKIVADATVDVAIGVGSMAAGAAVGAQVGAAVGSVVPVAGTIVGGVVGAVAGVGVSVVTDVVQINGKSISEWAKDGVKSAIDGGLDLAKSAGDAISSLFD
ncbi:WXG100 family type VII secretion target [Paenibacillus turpanensis]|uniref:WXG100 family type VII secretion target n=1 Tax=Paenibacillus turpanensis TaxID=2689078 RepID=UPI00140CF4A6|nr:WXG100 family type VII secretion target [Paenibacillus turpanensis]